MTALRDQEYNFNLENDAADVESAVVPIPSIVETTSKSISAAEVHKEKMVVACDEGSRRR